MPQIGRDRFQLEVRSAKFRFIEGLGLVGFIEGLGFRVWVQL